MNRLSKTILTCAVIIYIVYVLCDVASVNTKTLGTLASHNDTIEVPPAKGRPFIIDFELAIPSHAEAHFVNSFRGYIIHRGEETFHADRTQIDLIPHTKSPEEAVYEARLGPGVDDEQLLRLLSGGSRSAEITLLFEPPRDYACRLTVVYSYESHWDRYRRVKQEKKTD